MIIFIKFFVYCFVKVQSCCICFLVVSSAYKYVFTELAIVGKSFVFKMSSSGPRAESRGTTP